MNEFKNFIVFSSSKDNSVSELVTRLKKGAIGDVNLISHRSDVVEMISSKGFFGLYIDEVISKRDIEIVFRFILNSEFHKNKHFYIATTDPSKFKSIIETFYMFDLTIVNLPSNPVDIAKLIVDHEKPDQTLAQELKKDVGKIKGFAANDSIDLNFLKLFVDATLKVVKEMSYDDSITHGPPMILEKLETPPEIAIRGYLEIETRPYNGLFYISFPKETFLAFYERLVGEKHSEINSSNEDLVKELMNIIYGEAKKNFANLGYGGELGKLIPSLTKVSKIQSDQSIIVIPYQSAFGAFYIKVAPKKRTTA